jgi:hypothetical protein
MTNLGGTSTVPFEGLVSIFGHGRVVTFKNSDVVAGSAEFEGCG